MIGLAERKFQQRFVQRSAQVVAPQKRRPYAYAEVAELYISGIKILRWLPVELLH